MDSPAKLLVVDDDPQVHELVNLLFASTPGPQVTVLHALEGRAAWELLLLHQDLDAIVLDLVMPVMDGLEVLSKIKADRRFRHLPVCVFTGNRDQATRALQMGARDFVQKPGDYEEIRLRLANLIESKRRAEEAERTKVDFLSVVTHELRTPMNGVLGLTQALRDGGLTEDQQSYLEALEKSAHKMLSLIEGVIGYLESDNPFQSFPREVFAIREVVEGVWQRFDTEAQRLGVTRELVLAPGLPARVWGLPDQLRTILGHLVGNAVKFSPGGRVTLEVRGLATPPHPSLEFRIRDTGIGFPLDRRDVLFEPFTQLDGSVTRTYGGLGIGLAVATRLVHRLGGSLEVTSLSPGTEFRFALSFPDP
jgi:signal transduction histidine kinase